MRTILYFFQLNIKLSWTFRDYEQSFGNVTRRCKAPCLNIVFCSLYYLSSRVNRSNSNDKLRYHSKTQPIYNMATPNAAEIQYQLSHIQEDRSKDIVNSHIVCAIIAIIAVSLRLASRRLCKAAILADDYVCFAALIFALGEVTGGLMCVRYGGGKHAVLLKNPETFAKWVITTEVFYNAAITTIKLSILLLYGRLFPLLQLRRILWSVGVFVISCWLTITLLTIFQCRPIRAAWDLSVKGHCLRLNVAYIVLGTCNTITDMIALCLPMPLIWRLHTNKSRKVQLIGVFSLGALTCGVSLYRIPKMAQLSLSDAPCENLSAPLTVCDLCKTALTKL